MAGPAIRCLELGRQLAQEFDVTVASPCAVNPQLALPEPPGMAVKSGLGKGQIYEIANDADIIFLQANVLKPFPNLANAGKFVVVDLYDPYLFSLLAQYSNDQATASSSYRLMHQVLERHMLIADFTVCASERQRDYWLGRFCALGRLDPRMCKLDPTARKLIDVVPYGLPNKKPVHQKAAIKGIVPGITADDQVLLWTGGIWDWFDPLTVIQAVARCHKEIPQLRLFFMGMKSPNPQVPLMPMALEAQRLAADLKLLNKVVFFNETWVNYEERANYLLEADAAVSAHFDTIETRFSFRTRILDNLWANLPTLTTAGDRLADLIALKGAGFALPYKDVDAWARAIATILTDHAFNQQCRLACAQLAANMTWEEAAKPLLAFCRQPYHLPVHQKVTMPSFLERARAVYSRGGKELVLKRSQELINDMLN